MATDEESSPTTLTTRRKFLLAGGLAGGGVMGLAEALDEDGGVGSLWAGLASLSKAYNVAGNLWVGPDSAKANVPANSGRVYMATDIQTDYYGDGGSWVAMGIGTAANPVPASHFQSLTTEQVNTVRHVPADTTDAAQEVLDILADVGEEGAKVVLPTGTLPWKQEFDLSSGNANLADGTVVILEGQGHVEAPEDTNNKGGTVLDCSSLGTAEAAIISSGTNISRQIEIRDCTFRGRTDANAGTSSEPNGLEPGSAIDLKNVGVYQFDTGILAEQSLIDVEWQVAAERCVTGINTTGDIAESEIDIRVRQCTGTPAVNIDVLRTSVLNPYVESNEGDGLYLGQIDAGCMVHGGHFESNATGGVTKATHLWIKNPKNAQFTIYTTGGPDPHVLLGESGVTPANGPIFMGSSITGRLDDENGYRAWFIGGRVGEVNLTNIQTAFYLGTVLATETSLAARNYLNLNRRSQGLTMEMSPIDLNTFDGTDEDRPGLLWVSDGTRVTEGPAYFDGTTWTSLVDGTTFTP